MSLRAPILFAALAACSLVGTLARASVSLALDLEQLVARSDVIVVARVLHQASYWDERQRIVTDVRLRVLEGWAGARAGDELMLRTLGGVVEEVGLRVTGEPHLTDGSRVVLFARTRPGRAWLRPTAGSQGVMALAESRGGTTLVYPGGQNQHLRRVEDGRMQPARPALDGPTELGRLRAQVAQVIREAGRE